ncbi:MAG: FtsX-like permease family protein [Gammaproteobacteria bacterium]|jgi:putative ABC transport system permease protein|nr:FtsX-like permease family protein [Gammaproteobacteria bacterium]MBT3723771.1 FtsX-like permease family protein [Gammaproteobacteria bacterium]MBT4075774.1 FtsX-like permease family protein [Gammaproteobacteria bacterium]MBT4196435.1 FtsX-like permease family protein [Gammaproteobacteria bacterium]MBT4448144.1 FtsX-like permease family protein [Gammaproteobacteria bacterium]
MLTPDFLHLTSTSLLTHKLRSFLTMLGISVGISAVVLLTSIGEGIHQFILSEFTQFGTTLVAVNPGKTTTMGMSMGVFGTERPLTIGDAEAMNRLSFSRSVVGLIQGNAEVEGNNRSRRTTVYGTGSDFPEAFKMPVQIGQFLPHDDPLAPRALVVLGSKVKQELFAHNNPIGQRIRIGGDRYRVVGVMAAKGQVLGFDLDDTVYIPLARGLEMFNREGLMEIDLLYHEGVSEQKVVAGIKRLLMARHGREDFTITTQQQMLDVMGSILNIITFAVAAIGAISLLVGAIGIITIMTISVAERTSEIGLMRALGASHSQILSLFLGEAVVLSAIGGVVGLLFGIGTGQLLHLAMPALPVHTPWTYVVLAEISAIFIGLAAGVIPAQRAARLDPVEALRDE